MTSAQAPCAVGIDVGGTKIAAGLVDPQGRVWARRVVPTDAHRGGAAVLATTERLAAELLAHASTAAWAVAGIGVAVCELVDPAGNVTSSHTVDWAGMPVQETLSQLAPVVVESDVRAPALAEARFGAGQDFTSFAYVTVGTGISSCLVIDGVPWAGERGNALVLATMPLTVAGADGALVEFTLEEYASGPALARRYAQSTGHADARSEDVLAAAAQGEPEAREIVRNSGMTLGSAVAWLVNVTDPAAVIVGGGLGLAGGLYWESFVQATRAHIYAESTRTLPIVPAALSVDAGLVGAAAAVFQRTDQAARAGVRL